MSGNKEKTKKEEDNIKKMQTHKTTTFKILGGYKAKTPHEKWRPIIHGNPISRFSMIKREKTKNIQENADP